MSTIRSPARQRGIGVFYSKLLTGLGGPPGNNSPTLGPAVLAARQVLYMDGRPDWAAYQLYGDPDFRFWDTTRTLPVEWSDPHPAGRVAVLGHGPAVVLDVERAVP